MKSRNTLISVAAVALAITAIFLMRRKAVEQDSVTEVGSSSESQKTPLSEKLSVSAEAVGVDEMWRRYEIQINLSDIDAAIATNDPKKWRPLLGQVRHFNVPREKGIALLRRYLDIPNLNVRAAAAQYLFELGSQEGGPPLLAMLQRAASGEALGLDIADIVSTLYQYRYPIDGDLVYAAYQREPTANLLKYAQLLGSSQAMAETKARLLTKGTFQSSAQMAGAMRLKDPESLSAYAKILESARASDREEAIWALYRATGDATYLQGLISAAEKRLDAQSTSTKQDDSAGRVALKALQQLVTPETTAALRQIEASARSSGQLVEANQALVGLFYFHHDYEYVDKLLLSQFAAGTSSASKVEPLWNLAAARSSPKIAAAAKAFNNEAYEREFIRKSGRPVENWVFQYVSPDVPSDTRTSGTSGQRGE